tara:strand:- start:412 stop:594 length:183 start_codon:yes stop_codon:yes gene_type:complete
MINFNNNSENGYNKGYSDGYYDNSSIGLNKEQESLSPFTTRKKILEIISHKQRKENNNEL